MTDLSPIGLDYRLTCNPQHAFDTYTGDIAEWWDPRYTASAETYEGVTIEPRVGGRIFERHRGGIEHNWGRVTVWEPGRRLVHTFALAQDPAHPSEVSIVLEPEGDGCLLRFAHGGWTSANVAHRKKFGDWPVLLERFASLAERSA
jgi:uncharacterized protein YndB with AHSA1/START domain